VTAYRERLLAGDHAAPSESAGPPAVTAKKADWVAYAIEEGWDEETATASTKADLVEALS
jgi:hypothetical protein